MAVREGKSGDITVLLTAAASGDRTAAADVMPLVYEQLRAVACKAMAGEHQGHTLTATALVHEAYLRLVGDRHLAWQSRAHFYAAAAEAMRRILIDHARARGAAKRGGRFARAALDVRDVADLAADPTGIVALDDAIRCLGTVDPRSAEVVHLRFFTGLSVEETALAMGLSERTVKRLWAFARAWLLDALSREAEVE